jgi:Tfp pilus assembly protein PilF
MRLFLFISVASLSLVPSMRAQSASQTSNTAGPAQSTVFFSGEVLLEDGSAPPTTVIVQQICSGTARESVVTDAQGHFTLKVDGGGDKNTADASQGSGPPPDLNKPMGNSSIYSQPVTSSLRDCELQAVLAGYRSDRAGMAIKSTLDNVRVGTILLHPLTRAAAATISATTVEAPSRARKAYDKGMLAAKAQKWDAAVNEFTNATTVYPKFAAAWYELGLAHQNRNELPDADAAFKEALKSDPKYVKPYQSLTASSYKQEQWADLDNYSTQWIQLDPDDFPAAYLFSAFAKAKRGKVDEAEQAARQGIRIDKDHSVPKLNYVLGILLMQKKAYAESAQCFRAYLQQAPNSNEAVIVRDQLPKLEAAAAQKPAQP